MREGDLAPEFELLDETGTTRRLSELLANGPVVLFFYPAALSPGCTRESCHFRDLAGEFRALGAQPVGISADAVDKQQQFADRHGLGFPLLSDTDGAVARGFGVKRRFGPLPVKRATFVIGQDMRLLAMIASETRMEHHADRALALLRATQAA